MWFFTVISPHLSTKTITSTKYWNYSDRKNCVMDFVENRFVAQHWNQRKFYGHREKEQINYWMIWSIHWQTYILLSDREKDPIYPYNMKRFKKQFFIIYRKFSKQETIPRHSTLCLSFKIRTYRKYFILTVDFFSI